MTALIIGTLALTVALDVIGQVAFKLGLASSAGARHTNLWTKVTTTPFIWLGLATYAVEFMGWLFVLSHVPLNVAFPIASLSYCGIALASHFILREHIPRRRWVGTALIALGAAIVSVAS